MNGLVLAALTRNLGLLADRRAIARMLIGGALASPARLTAEDAAAKNKKKRKCK